MEISYHREGDYLIPNLVLADTVEYHIGKYGRMRRRFLEENHRDVYSHMLLSETLWKHLAGIDGECNEMMDRLVRQMAKNKGVVIVQFWFCSMRHGRCQEPACGGLDIICVPCYGAARGTFYSPLFMIFQ